MDEKCSLKLGRERLAVVMKSRGINGVQLAGMLGVHPETIQKIKSREATTLKRIEEISKALDCSPFDLLEAEGFPEPFLGALASH